MKKILIAVAALIGLASCQQPAKCYQCRVTETTSHGIAHSVPYTLEICGEDQARAAQGVHVTYETQWIGPEPGDSLTIEIVKETDCGFATVAN